jgi:protoporphyrin/coproporphyrin ferrochelatase
MKKGVLLFNLGGPENLQDVRPFLYNLFSDPEIIRIKSNALRKMLAWMIASTRQGKSRDLYRQIGGGSPLRKITEAQAAALGDALRARGEDARVYLGMRCWKPTIDEAVERILQDGIEQLVLLPLFPQYSVTTTGSCLKYFQALDKKLGLSARMDISTVESWCDEPLYIEAMADLIREGIRGFSGGEAEKIHLLYSAHSIPARYVEQGDPYLEQTKRSVGMVHELLGNSYPFTVAFQSKVGPVKWLSPSTRDVLVQLGREGKTRVLVVPISFVSDHIETLQEIDIQYKELAAQSGIREFRRAAALNLHPKFITALAALAQAQVHAVC